MTYRVGTRKHINIYWPIWAVTYPIGELSSSNYSNGGYLDPTVLIEDKTIFINEMRGKKQQQWILPSMNLNKTVSLKITRHNKFPQKNILFYWSGSKLKNTKSKLCTI